MVLMSSKGACVLWILTEMSFPSILPSQLPFADAAHHKDDHFAMVPTSRAAFKGLTGRRPQSSDWFAASGNDSAAWSARGGSGMLLNVLTTTGRFFVEPFAANGFYAGFDARKRAHMCLGESRRPPQSSYFRIGFLLWMFATACAFCVFYWGNAPGLVVNCFQ